MEKDFYKAVLKETYGIDVMIPDKGEREIIHNIIYRELVHGIIKDESRLKFKAIINRLAGVGAEGVILGCTEIPLLISDGDVSIPVFDTTRIHAEKAVEWTEAKGEKFDWMGTLIYMPSMAALMYGFSKMPTTFAIVLSIAGIAGLVLFVLVEFRFPFPLLNMKLFFANKVFASSNLSAFINYAATFAVSFVLSLYLQFAKHLSPKQAGLVLVTQPVIMALVAVFSGRLSDKINPRWLASSGMAVSVVGLAMLTVMGLDTSIQFIVLALGILGFGFGLFSSPNTNMVMSSVERRYYGIASATIGTMRATGMMFSMAIASLSIHIFIGTQKISDSNIDPFISSSQLIFLVFTILCVVGVFSSFVGKSSYWPKRKHEIP